MDGLPKVSALFAYGASELGDKHARAFQKKMVGDVLLDLEVEKLAWQAANLGTRKYDERWIGARFPREGVAHKTWVASFTVGFRAASKRVPGRYRWFIETDIGDRVRKALPDAYEKFTSGSFATAADVLAYLRRPGPAIDYVAERIDRFANGPRLGARMVVGHSLGGIVLVDALSKMTAEGRRPDVDLLVTVGSQAPYLYACNALGYLQRGDPEPPVFRPWLNVWNPNDPLSFPAEPAFGIAMPGRSIVGSALPGGNREFIRDVVAFPLEGALLQEAHSAYFELSEPVMPRAVRMALEDIGVVPANEARKAHEELLESTQGRPW